MYQMTSEWASTYNCQKYPVHTRYPNFHSFRSTTFTLLIQGCRKSNLKMMHRITSDWSYTLDCQNTLFTLTTFPRSYSRSTSWSVSLHDKPSSRYTFVDNQKCTKWLQTVLEHLLGRPKFRPFCSTTSSLVRYQVTENWKCIEWNQTDLKH